ncbi:hypothetical protein BRYFOR_08824 [Marvinbryantia formatexigens DSM 14469]|uniref:Uncharacterized protein n=2 Tax=Marvinbryantia TaxID=248744 RepID=C6LJI7_9FIRM|nr:hypothetical protein BRYFOR_08824 [Marvinbryantia formatexigens DSM 14469]
MGKDGIVRNGGWLMRRMEFTIEDNGDMLTVGQVVTVKEYLTTRLYSYMIEHAIGMSRPYGAGERLKTDRGKVVEVKKTDRFNIAVLEFDE